MASLRVIEIFDSLQGEGYWTGVPMTFVRLAGCNAAGAGLGCARWCDTPGSWSVGAGEELDAFEILEQVHLPRLCLTGGEPLLQSGGVAVLVAQAHGRGIKVHLETNGTLPPPVEAGSTEPTGGGAAPATSVAPPGPAGERSSTGPWSVPSRRTIRRSGVEWTCRRVEAGGGRGAGRGHRGAAGRAPP